MISDSGLLRYINSVETIGIENTIDEFGIDKKSLNRYLLLAKERGIEPTTTWKKAPKVLVFDIETLPMEVYSWGVGYNINLSIDNIIKEWCVLSWSAKWLLGDEIMFDCVTPEEAIERDDRRILQGIWELFDEADVLIGHNGRRFDVRKLNARFIYSEMLPPSPYDTIDTYKDITKVAAFTSFKQAYLTQFFQLEEKLDTSYSLWKRCAVGEQDALDEMLAYNKQDVVGLEELYITLRPWLQRHPSMNLYYGDMREDRCHRCGATDIAVITQVYTTPSGQYETCRCNKCGGIGRRGKNKIRKPSRMLRTPAR